MDDRELLTYAAKAAGIGPLDFDYAEREGHHFYMGPRLPMPQGVLMAAMWTYWRPLEDDGDALRLAMQLDMTLDLDGRGIYAQKHGATGASAPECSDEDKPAHVRRSIVRVAAYIGKSMP